MTNLNAILENLVDLENGIIPLTGPIDENMYSHVLTSLMALQTLKSGKKEITFILNTYGGDVYQALAIYDLIKSQKLKTVIICNGPVMSAGTIILQAADERIMTKRSYLMYHFGDQTVNNAQTLFHFNEITEDLKIIYKNNSKITDKIINNWFTKDTFYNAEQAFKLGLIDGIDEYESTKEKKNAKRIRL